MLKNTETKFGIVAKTFHWGMALLILGLLSVGAYMAALPFSPFKLTLYGWHKSFGTLVLILAVLRLTWRLFNPKPASPSTHKPWEKRLSKIIHVLLYGVLFLMPLSGWVMSSAGDFPNSFFGLFEMPDLVGKHEAVFKLSHWLHEIFAFVIIGAVGLHALGALKHHFIDCDETLKRMSAQRVGFKLGAILALGAGILLALPIILTLNHTLQVEMSAPNVDVKEQSATQSESEARIESNQNTEQLVEAVSGDKLHSQDLWQIDYQSSQIDFEATQYGQAFSGGFKKFSGDIRFNPENLENSRADIVIDIISIKTGSDDRDEQVLDDEWFNASLHPRARFVTTAFRQIDTNHYEAQAQLTIRGVTLPVMLPFKLNITPHPDGRRRAKMTASLSLNRLEFGVGQGKWEATDAIGGDVRVQISLVAFASES